MHEFFLKNPHEFSDLSPKVPKAKNETGLPLIGGLGNWNEMKNKLNDILGGVQSLGKYYFYKF